MFFNNHTVPNFVNVCYLAAAAAAESGVYI